MSPDDTRHGTWAGYQIGCRDECCTTGARNYQKARIVDAHRGRPRTISSLGTRRRIEALACLGWSGYDIAVRLGHGKEWLRQVYIRDQIHRRTAERIAATYDELCMRLPPVDTANRRRMVSRTRRRAARKGWAPPLAWDDIDHDPEPASGVTNDPINAITMRKDVDRVVVWRVLNGDTTAATGATAAERRRIAACWAESGRSLASLARMTGWKPERYWRASA